MLMMLLLLLLAPAGACLGRGVLPDKGLMGESSCCRVQLHVSDCVSTAVSAACH
jgi:hypothetical protein